MSELPEAIIRESVWHRIGYWSLDVLKKGAIVGVVAGIATGGYGLTQVGCRNDAITYAHALNPDMSCSAVHTETGCVRQDHPDMAICRVSNQRWECSGGDSINGPACRPI